MGAAHARLQRVCSLFAFVTRVHPFTAAIAGLHDEWGKVPEGRPVPSPTHPLAHKLRRSDLLLLKQYAPTGLVSNRVPLLGTERPYGAGGSFGGLF